MIKGIRPAYYPGRVTLFRSADPEWDRLNMPDDLGWSQFCAEVSVRRVPGDHISTVTAANVECNHACCDRGVARSMPELTVA